MMMTTTTTYRSFLNGSEDTSRLHNICGTCITPFNVGWVPPAWKDHTDGEIMSTECTALNVAQCLSGQHLLAEDGDGVTVNDQLAAFCLNLTLVLAMGGVILEHVNL